MQGRHERHGYITPGTVQHSVRKRKYRMAIHIECSHTAIRVDEYMGTLGSGPPPPSKLEEKKTYCQATLRIRLAPKKTTHGATPSHSGSCCNTGMPGRFATKVGGATFETNGFFFNRLRIHKAGSRVGISCMQNACEGSET